LRAGFVEVTRARSQNLLQFRELFDRIIPGLRSLLVFPDPFAPPRTIQTLYVAAIVPWGLERVDMLGSLARTVLADLAPLVPSLPREAVIQIRIYLVYGESLSRDDVRGQRLRRKEASRRVRIPGVGMLFGTSMRVGLIPVDSSRGKAYFTKRNVEPDRQVKAALKQLQGAKLSKPSRSLVSQYVRHVLTKPLEGLRTYIDTVSLLEQPDVLAYQITSGGLQLKELLTAIGISSVVAGLAAELLGLDLGELNLGNSILDQIVKALIVMLIFLLSAGLTHVPLRLAGGQGSFRSTFIATTFLSAVAYPIVVVIVGMMMLLGISEEDAWHAGQYGAGGIGVWVLSPVHGLSLGRTLVFLFVIPAVVVLLLILIVGTLL
jgi:hypothetical protein